MCGVGMEGVPICFFKLSMEVLCKETSCDLSDLVDTYVVKYPMYLLRGV